MAAKFSFYDGKTYALVKDFSSEIIGDTFEYKNSPEGSASGSLQIQITDDNSSFLNSLKENSHFVSFYLDGESDLVGGIIEDSYTNDGICYIKYVGFAEYLDKIRGISSYHSNDFGDNVIIRDGDLTWEKTFLSDSPEGLLYEVMINLEEYMNGLGYSKFWEWDNIFAHIHAINTATWNKSYRLNSAEFPSMKSIYDEIVGDEDCPRLNVRVSTSGNVFKWILSFDNSTSIYNLNTATDEIYDLSFEFNGISSRANSLAKGQTPNGESVISKIPFSTNGAFSDYVANDTTNNSTDNAYGVNVNNISSLKAITGQISFKTQVAEYADGFSVFNIQTDTISSTMIVSEISFDGVEFTIRGNTTMLSENLNKLKLNKPANTLSGTIRNPLNESRYNARKSLFEENRTTGWRNV